MPEGFSRGQTKRSTTRPAAGLSHWAAYHRGDRVRFGRVDARYERVRLRDREPLSREVCPAPRWCIGMRS